MRFEKKSPAPDTEKKEVFSQPLQEGEGSPDDHFLRGRRQDERRKVSERMRYVEGQIARITFEITDREERPRKYLQVASAERVEDDIRYFKSELANFQGELDRLNKDYEETPRTNRDEEKFQKTLDYFRSLKKAKSSDPKNFDYENALAKRLSDINEYRGRPVFARDSIIHEEDRQIREFPRLLAALGETEDSVIKMQRRAA